jgi:hypothetical protein
MVTTCGWSGEKSREAEEWRERAGRRPGTEEARGQRLSALCAFYRRARQWAPASTVTRTVGRNSGGGHVLSTRRVVCTPWFRH